MTSTIGTKTAVIRSASRAMGALPVCASETSRPIWASVVSLPTRVARTSRRPEVLMVAPVTVSSGPTSTGMDSPVTREVSTAEWPVTTKPSVAIFSPGRTTNLVAGNQLGGRDLHLDAVAQHGGFLGAQVQQGLQRVPGAGLGPRLQVAAQQQEGGDHAGGFEVELRARSSPCRCVRSSSGRAAAATGRRSTRPARRWTPACPWWRRSGGH